MREVRCCGRTFTESELELIRRIAADRERHPHRLAISRAVCEQLGWLRPDGRVKDMSARVALLRMHRDGPIVRPPPRRENNNGRRRPSRTAASDPGPAVEGAPRDLSCLRLRPAVNNARFLILPWVRVRNLASWVLGRLAKRMADDGERRYACRPVLLETFVERDRFRGTCYRAANWSRVGQTQGRGKLDRRKRYDQPAKEIFPYPLANNFREVLAGGPEGFRE
ncbi:MAG: DUF4338 domain-containing protein [Thermaerobacter sp.]|nr:DUF4338 domain-containing protein [Thermaerobacter sp.]